MRLGLAIGNDWTVHDCKDPSFSCPPPPHKPARWRHRAAASAISPCIPLSTCTGPPNGRSLHHRPPEYAVPGGSWPRIVFPTGSVIARPGHHRAHRKRTIPIAATPCRAVSCKKVSVTASPRGCGACPRASSRHRNLSIVRHQKTALLSHILAGELFQGEFPLAHGRSVAGEDAIISA